METNKGASENLVKLVLMDPETGKEELVERDPRQSRGFRERACFPKSPTNLIATVYKTKSRRIYWKDKTFEADYKWLPGSSRATRSTSLPARATSTLAGVRALGHGPGTDYLFDRKQTS